MLLLPPGTPQTLGEAIAEKYEQTGELAKGVTIASPAREGEGLSAPPGPPNVLARLRDYLTQATAQQIQPYQELLTQTERGYPQLGGTEGTPEEQALATARGQVPQTPGQLLGNAAQTAMPFMKPTATLGSAALQALQRLGIMGGAEGAGALLEGKGLGESAIEATSPFRGLPILLEAAGLTPGAVSAVRAHLAKRPLTDVNVATVVEAINEVTPGITFHPPASATPGAEAQRLRWAGIDPKQARRIAALGEPPGPKQVQVSGPLAEGVQGGPQFLEWIQKNGINVAGKMYDGAEELVKATLKRVHMGRPSEDFIGLTQRGMDPARAEQWIRANRAAEAGKDIEFNIPILNEWAKEPLAANRPVSELLSDLKTLRSAAYGDKPLPKEIMEKGFDPREMYAQATAQLREKMTAVSPEAAELLWTAKEQYSHVRRTVALMREADLSEAGRVFPPGRKGGSFFNLEPLQHYIARPSGEAARGVPEPILAAIRRGGPVGSADLSVGLPGGRVSPRNLLGLGFYLPRVSGTAFVGGQPPIATTGLPSPLGGARTEIGAALLQRLLRERGLEGGE